MLSLQAEILRRYIRMGTRRHRVVMGRIKVLRRIASMNTRFLPMPASVVKRRPLLDGLPLEIYIPRQSAQDKALLYLHGGGYVIGGPDTHRALAARLGKAAGLQVWLPDYRLAPEHPFPAAIDDVLKVWRTMKQEFGADNIQVAGDSAGGGLSVALCLKLMELGESLPDRLFLLSPWLDLSLSGDSYRRNQQLDPMVYEDWIRQDCAANYIGDAEVQNPLISPFFADEKALAALPPTYIQVGTDEILLDDSLLFAQKVRAAGAELRLDVADGLWHVWQLLAPFMPEANAAIAQAGIWLGGELRATEVQEPVQAF